MSVLTLIDGVLRLDENQQLVLSPDAGPPCCCGCRPDQLSNAAVKLSANHGCDCAKFKFYVNNNFIKDVNLNNAANPGVAQEQFNANISAGAVVNESCCEIQLRLDCNVSPSDDAGFGFGITCAQNFGDPPCHTNITQAEITLPNGKVIVAGILPNATNTPVQICPDDLALQQAPSQKLFTDSCSCCGGVQTRQKRLTKDAPSGVGTILWGLIKKVLFRGSAVDLGPQVTRYIETTNLIDAATWEQNRSTLFDILRYLARTQELPFDSAAADIIIRRALSLARVAQANG